MGIIQFRALIVWATHSGQEAVGGVMAVFRQFFTCRKSLKAMRLKVKEHPVVKRCFVAKIRSFATTLFEF
jgi:hypothetical protein